MVSDPNDGLLLREKASKMSIYTRLKQKVPFCKKPVKYWIIAEPNSFKGCPIRLCTLFKCYIVHNYLKSDTPLYSSYSNTDYEFYKRMSRLDDPESYFRNIFLSMSYMMVGRDSDQRKFYFSTTITEDAKAELTKELSTYAPTPDISSAFFDVELSGRCCRYPPTGVLPLLDLLQNNDIAFLPPSDYGSVPCEVFFYHFREPEAIVYRDLFMVYRSRAVKRGYSPGFHNILKVFHDPPYEIFITNVDENGKILEDRKERYNEVYNERDVTWAERHCYQKYTVCKVNRMRKWSSSYFTLSFLQDHLGRNPVFHRKGKNRYKIMARSTESS
ncbi:uncharacterized protein NDAI_0C06320 [Naumovozyma dairenensis CBS 421]|uniref:Uncharacterized protein n=1 Tax=Naumovozyma dairenensis (strain ATCC 10597 / BCRC 20456 / CBS 421 / NBRC 0211 / NRRL Y-12639) TaxID=1071378 RepID=G0W930_NAUDC|nr:hypothetical protein NDAI_0C06320 [Naumovozyma dairenensis CBS 421]CCD24291.1 hypothetical protein NDAI_0C06320 [Naumovozyma dairenensis CBS 421]